MKINECRQVENVCEIQNDNLFCYGLLSILVEFKSVENLCCCVYHNFSVQPWKRECWKGEV